MSIASDIQLATRDLSFEVSSDLSSRIFVWTEVKPDFSLPMPKPCEKEHSYTLKLREPASQIARLNPLPLTHTHIIHRSPSFILDLFAKKTLFFFFFYPIISNAMHLLVLLT